MRPFPSSALCLAAAATLVGMQSPAAAQDTKEPPVRREVRVIQRVEQKGTPRLEIVHGEPGKTREYRYVIDAASATPVDLGKYWIGLTCSAASPALRAQLGLEEGKGLVVESLHADAPAAKAGIQKYDVLVSAGDSRLGTVKDLIDAVQKAETEELTVGLIRKGDRSEVKVTPAERPEAQRSTRILLDPAKPIRDGEFRRLYDWIARPGVDRKMHMMFIEPGVVVNGALTNPPLPGGVSISITRTGKEPARLHIKRGDQEWKITEKELNKLPDDLRPHVARMLGGGPTFFRNLRLPQRGAVEYRSPQHHPPGLEGRRVIVRPDAVRGEAAQDAALKQLRDELRKLSEKVQKLEKDDDK